MISKFILIVLDALRADHLGCYGYPRSTSPNIDRLAETGTIFLNAISASSMTGPSFTSLFTGTYPQDHGLYFGFGPLTLKYPTLAELLLNTGLRTAAFVGHRGLDPVSISPGFDRGFERYDFNFNQAFAHHSRYRRVAEQTLEGGLSWLKSHSKEPFLVFIHLSEPHPPYRAGDRRFRKMFLGDALYRENDRELPLLLTHQEFGGIPLHVNIGRNRNVAFHIAQYDAQIAYADFHLGIFIEGLKQLGIWEDTFVALLADHGESMGEHNYYFKHGHSLTDELIKVPLIIHGPDVPSGRRVEDQVQLIDLAPTICELAGVGHTLKTAFRGRNITSHWHGQPPPAEAYSSIRTMFGLHLFSVRTNESKFLLCRAGEVEVEQFYSLKDDPGELHDLAGQGLPEETRLRGNLMRLNSESVTGGSKKEEADQPLDIKTLRQLRGLGYAE